MFQRAIPILDSFDSSNNYDLNQVIELSNIVQIVKSIDCPTNITPEKFNEYRKETDAISRFVSSYFQQLDLSDIENIFQSIWTYYSLDLLKLLERFDLLKNIPNSGVQNLLNKKLIPLFCILECKGWVKKYNQVITDYMMDNKDAAEIIIKYYLVKDFAEKESIVFPKVLTEEKKISVLNYYVDGAFEPHPNYLELIENAPIIPGLNIDDRLRLKAKKAKEKYWEKHFSERSSFSYGCIASFKEIDEEKNESYNETDHHVYCTYSKKWVREHHDFPTLLNNFIFLFGFFDSELRCQFVLKKKSIIDELLAESEGIKHYPIRSQFTKNRMIYYKILSTYKEELENYGICIEDLFDYFFGDYLKENFGISDFEFKKPSKSVSLSERIKLLYIEMDGILKQLKYYMEDGCVDKELVAISSNPVRIGELKSFLKQKYAYVKGESLKKEMRFLFSFNLLFGMNFAWSGYNSLVEIIAKEHLFITDFAEQARVWIKWLIERGALLLEADNSLGIDIDRCSLLYNLYENEVVCFAHQKGKQKEILKELVEKEEVEVESTIFSRQERDYYNFVLNKKEFSNSLDLRNTFLHGSFFGSEEELQQAYIETLKVFIMIVVKVNEEFCLKYFGK
ncbi:hypothetical protein [Fibrobacter succinogenes]|nr:hypothetical protein [Fibrobacter succinogenes]